MPAHVSHDQQEGCGECRGYGDDAYPKTDGSRDGQGQESQSDADKNEAHDGAGKRRDAGWQLLTAARHVCFQSCCELPNV